MNTPQPIKLSILVCTIEKRKQLLDNLISIIQPQLDNNLQVECVVVSDKGTMPIGMKRNILIGEASGEYICFIDDDDIVGNDYVERILNALQSSPDVVVFDAFRFENGKPDRVVKYGIEYAKDYHDKNAYYRLPNHLMVVKKDIADKVPFKPKNFGEDSDYAQRLKPHLKTQERINEILYQYLYVTK